MPDRSWRYLDEHLRLKLNDLSPKLFEDFFLHFLNAGISLSVERHGRQITRRIINAESYAAGSGREQKGIDLRAEVEGDGAKEVWVFQCKRSKKWSPAQTRTAIERAAQYPAQHYFLAVACDPQESVQDEIHKRPNWTFWNLDKICSEFRLRVPPSKHAQLLFFLSPGELKRFIPFSTEALISPEKFFERFLAANSPFRHNWRLVGRQKELQALHQFATGPQKVQMLVAKGGDGKSRLLWELCRTLAHASPETQILCLNPHREDEDFSFSVVGTAAPHLFLVDDAHRAEQVPLALLSLVRQDRSSRIILATRPQGIEALTYKLDEVGLANDIAPQLHLPQLKRANIKALAGEALGNKNRMYEAELAELTRDSAFLTVVAGELLRTGHLTWGAWTTHKEFRQQIFREFEEKNFEIVPEADRDLARSLLRLIALLAPAVIDTCFTEKAAVTLDCPVFKLEAHLNRLRQSELVVGRDDGLRVLPDLFADFLVYESCYGLQKTPTFVKNVIEKFPERSAVLLRNLSEATWIARENSVPENELLKGVVDLEHHRFKAAGFYNRAQSIDQWSNLSIYLPAESLELARLALALETAPEEEKGVGLALSNRFNSHQYVCQRIPAMVRPIAQYHDHYRWEALDFLWELGLRSQWVQVFGNNQNHPFSVIADVIKYEPRKPITVVLSALEWVEAQLKKPLSLAALEGSTPILRTLLSPCFERFIEFKEWEARTVRWWHEPVSIEKTQIIRDRALSIIEWTIDHGSWRAALDALSALENGIHRVGPIEEKRIKDEADFRVQWRPERQKALAVYERAFQKHGSVAIRHEIRRTLKLIIAYEEDAEFRAECRRVLTQVPEDLALRTAMLILSPGTFDFEEAEVLPTAADRHERCKALWQQSLRSAVRELAETYPEPLTLLHFLDQLMKELTNAGNHPLLSPVLAEMAQTFPLVALGLAEQILRFGRETPLAKEWAALIETNEAISDEQKDQLYRKALESSLPDMATGIVRQMASQVLGNKPIRKQEQEVLLQIARSPNHEAAFRLLQIVQWSGEANLPWAFELLGALPIQEIAPRMLREVLRALVPYQERQASPPRHLVQKVIQQLLLVRELDLYHNSREWDLLNEKYPREIYLLMRERIAHATSGDAPPDYQSIPLGFHQRLQLPTLAREPDYPAICDELWKRVLDRGAPERYAWVRLFQAVVLETPGTWMSRMREYIGIANSEETLRWLTQLLNYEGSLIIFHFPEITKDFLMRAKAIGGDPLCKKIQSDLYSGCGPQMRSYSNGVLDKDLDYVEAEAARAAEVHAADELLGRFYRWIVEIEQKGRVIQKMQAEETMATYD